MRSNLKADLGRQEYVIAKNLGDNNILDDSTIYYRIGDRCEAKSFFRERFFGSFSSLNCEAHHEFQNQYKMDE